MHTVVLLEVYVLNLEVVSLEAAVGFFLGRAEAFVELREEDPGVGSGSRILEALQERSQHTVGFITGLLAALQKIFHVHCQEEEL